MANTNKKVSNFSNKPFDFVLFIIILLLLALGIIMVLSASAPSALAEYGNSYAYVTTQGISAVAGIIGMLIISKFDYRIYKKFYKIIYIACIGLLAIVAVPGIGHTANNATRWINLGFTTFQPSELVKIGLIIFYATYLTEHRNELSNWKTGFIKPLLYLVPIILILVLVQNHLSATVVIVAIVAVMMLTAGTKLKHFAFTGLPVAGAGVAALIFMGNQFRLQRLISFLDPWQDAKGTGWQVIQGLYAIGSGGLFGLGLGNSKQKYLYIPEPQNDFIFAVLAEELGFVGCVAVILLFAIFIWRGILISMKAPDMFGSLVAIGITALVGIQAIINIAVVTSSIPNTGMPLPFFSYGGTALLILLCAMGVLLNISRASKKI